MNNFQLWQGDLKSNEYTLPLIGNPFKNFLKKLGTFALTTVMAFTLVGCGHDDPVVENPSGDDPTYTEPADPDITEPGGDTDDPVVTPGTDVKDPDDGKDDPVVTPDPGDDTDKDKDDQDKDDFSLAANQKAILENFKGIANYCAKTLHNNSYTADEVFDLAIKHENSNTIIDAIYTGTYKKEEEYLQYATITFSNQILTYEQIAANDMKLSAENIRCKSNYYFSMSKEEKNKYADAIDKLQQKLFSNTTPICLEWRGINYPQYDSHQLVCYDGKVIQAITISINNDGMTLAFPDGALNKYFINDEYKITANKIEATLPTDTLKTEVQKELVEQAQQS